MHPSDTTGPAPAHCGETYQVPPPPRVRARKRPGRCYELAAKGAMEFAGWQLVHGLVRGRGGPIGHAWLVSDCGQWIYDATVDRMYAADIYRMHQDAVELRRWRTSKEVAAAVRAAGHWGPLHEAESERRGCLQ